MKEAIGGLSIFQLVIVFLLLFTGIMCLTINHSKAFGVKDEVINIIEKEYIANNNNPYEEVIPQVIDYMQQIGHRITGKCDDRWVGYDLNGSEVSNDTAVICIRTVDVTESYYNDAAEKCKNGNCSNTSGEDYPPMIYYDIKVFYQLDIPIIKNVMNLTLSGSTKVLFG